LTFNIVAQMINVWTTNKLARNTNHTV